MKILFLLLLFSCTDILIQENENYKSVHLNNGGWISIPNQNYDLDKGLEIINDQFTLEIYFSGGKNNINTAGAIFSIMDNNDNKIVGKYLKKFGLSRAKQIVYIMRTSEDEYPKNKYPNWEDYIKFHEVF